MRKLNVHKMRKQLARSKPQSQSDIVLYYKYLYDAGPVTRWERILDKLGFWSY